MADIFGKALDFVGATANHKELLRALYLHFDGDGDDNWSIKGGVTVPATVAATGDTGFVLEDTATQTINIAIADHNGCGGVSVDAGALSASDDLLVGIDPGGGITDITSGGFTVGARWSGWASDAQGGTATSLDGRLKISSGADWLSIRFKQGGAYLGGFFAGKPSRQSENLGDGYVIFAGLWSDWGAVQDSDHKALELHDGTWGQMIAAYPLVSEGLTSPASTDGAGAFRTTPVGIALYHGASMSSNVQRVSPEAVFPHMWSSASAATAQGWSDGASARNGYTPTAGCWVFKDTEGDVE